MESEKFIKYLQINSLEGIISIPKSDLHNYLGNGRNIEYIKKHANIDIKARPERFSSLTEMEEWAHTNIKQYCTGLMRYEAAFIQAKNDNIVVLAMSVFRNTVSYFGSCEQFIGMQKEFKEKHIPDYLFLPELSYLGLTDADKIDFEYSLMDEILSYNYFKSVDLCIDQLSQPNFDYKSFSKIFRKAKNAGLKLKAHVGEWGTADDVMRAVEELELDEAHHGIAAVSSPQIMKWLARHKIRLNICPSCNIMLGRAQSYATHPIRILYDYGIPVTINSDDMLIVNQSVSQEYLNLYNCGLMTAHELDEIRLTGLDRKYWS